MDKMTQMAEGTIFSVSEFNELINLYLSKMGEVCVQGEISEIKINQGKWAFLTLRDDQANVEVFGVVYQLKNLHLLEKGMLIRVYGIPRLYTKTGRFSLMAREVVLAGEGAMQAAFEKLKVLLTKEGLFNQTRKRSLPLFPEKIGLITARGSQAFNDFTKVLRERMGGIKIYFYPVQVQGREAVSSILAGFDYFNHQAKKLNLDLIVIVRGGGSLEDLAAFNDEQIVRAIFSAQVPVVCGVGHEGDVSLADLVADLRASTPSNAAELLVKQRLEVLKEIAQGINFVYWRLKQTISQRNQLISRSALVISRQLYSQIQDSRQLLNRMRREMQIFSFTLKQKSEILLLIKLRLVSRAKTWITGIKDKVYDLERLLHSLDYQRTLVRGFSITFDVNGRIIKDVEMIKPEDRIITQLAKGKVESQVLVG